MVLEFQVRAQHALCLMAALGSTLHTTQPDTDACCAVGRAYPKWGSWGAILLNDPVLSVMAGHADVVISECLEIAHVIKASFQL